VNSRNAGSLLIDFINSLCEPLSADDLLRRFTDYLQEKFSDHSFALVAHDYSPKPYRLVSTGIFAEQVLPVLYHWKPKNRTPFPDKPFIKIKNFHLFPFLNHRQRVQYVLVGALTDSRTQKNVISLCAYGQTLFEHLGWTAQFSAERIQNKYRAYINNLTHDCNSLLTLLATININDPAAGQKLNYGRKLSGEFLFYLCALELSKISVTINELLTAVLQNYSNPVEMINLFPTGADRVRVMVDVELINKAICAVLDNAVYYAGLIKGGIQIEVSGITNISPFIDHDWLSLRIVNQGPLIPAEFLEQIKEPFFTTLKDQGKTGLGLAIADKIIRAHGGCLTVSNIHNDGVQVTIYLPWKEKYV
jgi:hypothetical protein